MPLKLRRMTDVGDVIGVNVSMRWTVKEMRLALVVAAIAFAACWFTVIQSVPIPDKKMLIAFGAGGLYIFSHLLRGVRLAMLCVPTIGLSARTAFLLHTATAPLSVLLPLKLGELVRLQQLFARSAKLLPSIMVLVVERLLDSSALLIFFVCLQIYGSTLSDSARILLWVVVTIVAASAVIFMLAPAALSSLQRYVLKYHNRKRALMALRYIDFFRRAVNLGADQLRHQGLQLGLITLLIWLFELFSMRALAMTEVVGTIAQSIQLLVMRTLYEWQVLIQPSGYPEIDMAVTINITVLIVLWPIFIWFYLQRVQTERDSFVVNRYVRPDENSPHSVTVLIDDRVQPNDEIEGILGSVLFSEILRKRKRLLAELINNLEKSADDVLIIHSDTDAKDLAKIIRTDPQHSKIYIRLCTCVVPSEMAELGSLVEKSKYALETITIGRNIVAEAPVILRAEDAVRLLSADTVVEKENLIAEFFERGSSVVDYVNFIDLRHPLSLVQFLTNSTETRHFNMTTIDKGIFRKTSQDVEKMRKEYKFFHAAPEQMKPYLQPTFDYWEADGYAGYSMEHLMVPDAAIQFVQGSFHESEFEGFVDTFFRFLETRKPGAIDKGAVADSANALFLQKMFDRLDMFLDTEQGKRLNTILDVSGRCGNLMQLRQRSEALIRKAIRIDRTERLVFGHGDPCFSNILYDRRIGLMRLIDPRGADALEDGMMHPVYDVAKFSHSVLGGYDFVNNDLFSCVLDKSQNLALQLDVAPKPWARQIFTSKLDAAGYDYFVVRAAELSLFMSMLPLHIDQDGKLVGFALIATNIIEELEQLH